jgi:hypothetical protein
MYRGTLRSCGRDGHVIAEGAILSLMTSTEIRMARALLRWTQRDLAESGHNQCRHVSV